MWSRTLHLVLHSGWTLKQRDPESVDSLLDIKLSIPCFVEVNIQSSLGSKANPKHVRGDRGQPEKNGYVFDEFWVEKGFTFLPSDSLLVGYKRTPSLEASLLVGHAPLSAL